MNESGFGRSYLPGVDFTYAVFGQCSFIEVDLREAIFRNATIGEIYFRKCNLAYVDFRGARELFFNSEDGILSETIMPDSSIRTDRF